MTQQPPPNWGHQQPQNPQVNPNQPPLSTEQPQWEPLPPRPPNAAIAWIKRHKILSGIGAAVLLLAVISGLAGGGEGSTSASETTPTVTATATVETTETVTATETVTVTETPSATEEAAPSPETTSPEITSEAPSKTEPATDNPAYTAVTVEKTFVGKLGGQQISDMCDAAYTHWGCFYDGVEATPSYLRVNLTTDGGWSDRELKELATSTGRHWFNFIRCDYPDLSTIVVSINGIDHNTYARDFVAINC